LLKLVDAALEIADAAPVGVVGALGDEAQVAGLVAPVDVFTVKLKLRSIPPRKRDQMREKRCAILPPRLVDVDAAPSVVGVTSVVRVVAAVDAGRDAVAEPSAMPVVGDDVGIAEPALDVGTGLSLGADVAAGGAPGAQVADRHAVRRAPARTLDGDASQPAEGAALETSDDKLAEPIANAWFR
jgi:hypothetical protein